MLHNVLVSVVVIVEDYGSADFIHCTDTDSVLSENSMYTIEI